MGKRTNSDLNGTADTERSGSLEQATEQSETPTRNEGLPASSLPFIPTGRRFDLKYEPQMGQPVDGGDPLVRLYSPFVLQYLPPADAQAYLGDMKPSRDSNFSGNVDTFKKALEGSFSLNTVYDGRVSQESYNSLEALSQSQTYQNLTAGKGAESSFVGSGQTLSYLTQLFALMNLPPLQFLINPNSMNITYTKIQDFSSRTRKNRVFKAWGEDQPKISFSAVTGAFCAMGTTQSGDVFDFVNTSQTNQSPSGVQYASKRHSMAFQHFMEILQMYQNAALLYDTLFDTEAHLGVGSFMIHYDQMTYEGLIESFDYSYQEDTPHSLSFNFDFTVSKMYDWNTQQGSPQRIHPPNARR